MLFIRLANARADTMGRSAIDHCDKMMLALTVHCTQTRVCTNRKQWGAIRLGDIGTVVRACACRNVRPRRTKVTRTPKDTLNEVPIAKAKTLTERSLLNAP